MHMVNNRHIQGSWFVSKFPRRLPDCHWRLSRQITPWQPSGLGCRSADLRPHCACGVRNVADSFSSALYPHFESLTAGIPGGVWTPFIHVSWTLPETWRKCIYSRLTNLFNIETEERENMFTLFRKYPIDKGCQRLISIQLYPTSRTMCTASVRRPATSWLIPAQFNPKTQANLPHEGLCLGFLPVRFVFAW